VNVATALTPEWTPPPVGEAVTVADGVLWLRLPLPMAGLDHVNLYALADGDGWTLVDTGLDWARGRTALAAALAGPLEGRPVHRVVVTHHHPDHIGMVGGLADAGARVLASRIAWTTGRMLTLDPQERPTAGQILFRRRAGVGAEGLARYAAERPFNFADCVQAIPLGFEALAEGDGVSVGGRRWTVRLGEGHAPGAVTLWSEDGLLIAGDQILPGISPNIGVYPTEPEADPLAGWLETCHRFAALGADPLILPGHRLPFRGLDARLGQLIDNHETALERIMAALAESPATAVALFGVLYRRTIDAGQFGLALAEAVAHVNHLHRAGRIRRCLDPDGAWVYAPTV
jgi:glyoxylase-like metal-dependent hydrolase (beta-lactamase superfamily II)